METMMIVAPVEMDDMAKAYLNIVNWMEVAYNNTVFVLDIDLHHYAVTLYGEPAATSKFRKELDKLMQPIVDAIPYWKEY